MRNRREFNTGLIFFASYLLLTRFTGTSGFFSGIIFGLAVVFIILEVIPGKLLMKIKKMKSMSFQR